MDALDENTERYREALCGDNVSKTPFERWGKASLKTLNKFKMSKGKHKGKTFEDIYNNEPDYIMWLIGNKGTLSERSNVFLFYNYVLRKAGK